MPIHVSCTCGSKFAAPDKVAGKKIKCPSCSEPLKVPPSTNGKSTNGKSTNGKSTKAKSQNSIKVACDCGKSFRASSTSAGKKVSCPSCRQSVLIPSQVVKSPVSATAANDPGGIGALLDEVGFQRAGGAGRCPHCKSDLRPDAMLCIECGYNLETGKLLRSRVKRKIEDEENSGIAPDNMSLGGAKGGSKKMLLLFVVLAAMGILVAMRLGLIPGMPGV